MLYNIYMAWETDRHGRTRYVQKIRVNGRVTSKVLGVGDVGREAEKLILRQRQEARQKRAQDREIKSKRDFGEQTVKQILEQNLINQGFIKRKSVWQRISRLNTPLTPKELARVNHIKSTSSAQKNA
jgi:homoserine dehydrogenase